MAIRAAGLGRRFDDRIVLEDVCLEVPRGGLVALMGANGAGKTTLLRILAMLMPPTSGELHILGEDIGPPALRRGHAPGAARKGPADVRRLVGYIAHEPMVYRDLSARANLEFFARLYEVNDPAGRAQELLDMMGLAGRADEPVRFFSRGMVQRLAIARALVHEPQLLLADEPFDALDAAAVEAVETMLGHLCAAGRTVVMVSHDVSRSLRMARQAVVLRRGRVVLSAPTDGLDAGAVLAEVKAS